MGENDDNGESDANKTASLLTPTHREFLQGKHDPPNDAAVRALQARIRSRIKAGMEDFEILLSHLDEDDEKKVFDEADDVPAVAFVFRRHIRDLLDDPEQQNTTTPHAYRNFIESIIRGALPLALEGELNRRGDETEYELDVNLDLDLDLGFPVDESTRLNIADVEHRLQNGELSFRELRQHFADGHITMTELQQLTRGHGGTGEPTTQQRKELLDKPVPMLAGGKLYDQYMRIKITDDRVGTVRMHDENYMPPGYHVRFSKDDRTAIVLKEIGERLVEHVSTIEAVEENGLDDYTKRLLDRFEEGEQRLSTRELHYLSNAGIIETGENLLHRVGEGVSSDKIEQDERYVSPIEKQLKEWAKNVTTDEDTDEE